ncbi:hypothetical protein BJ138DRAFT_1188331 [Hygrophoropsis aurantiaca]|uniref:Uncharacterized protein n=1 Tax=Hygrophoropsis aurantiaca TaxID=72124 RepID=A0ACB7ZRR8_9AGAM|nr:hypothetical protein BJ138DRAFT_1188331 [Hygrophoropsis aurantiaca]
MENQEPQRSPSVEADRSVAKDHETEGISGDKKCKAVLNLENIRQATKIRKLAGVTLSPSLTQTNAIIKNWAQDQKEVLSEFVNCEFCPEFPHSEWKNIIAGRPVDLDAIHTHAFSSQTEEKLKESIGDIEISFSHIPKNSKTIRTERLNSNPMQSSSHKNSANMLPPPATASYNTTRPSGGESVHAECMNSGTTLNSPISMNPTSRPPVISSLKALPNPPDPLLKRDLVPKVAKSVANGTPTLAAEAQLRASTNTFAPDAKVHTKKRNATEEIKHDVRPFKAPRHRRDLIWQFGRDPLSPTVKESLYADPVPQPSQNDFDNAPAQQTIRDFPHLFKIVCPINIPVFKSLLVDHPNQPFVNSVCTALEHGFWPRADTSQDYPSTCDNPNRPPQSDELTDFITKQFEEEVRLERFSEPFGLDLLPGMYNVPVHAVPKPHSDKFRLVVDHSAGQYSLNSMIERSLIAGVKLDGMQSLGRSLLRFREEHPHDILMMFKSDVSAAYRRMPMHFLWQIKQVVTGPNGQRHLDRCNNFGGTGSPKVWISFICLVIWIAIFVKYIEDLKVYMDDSFSFDFDGNFQFYPPYNAYYPKKQVKLLMLWDEIGLPHEKPKQVFGRTLKIIGFEVDPNQMSVKFPDSKCAELLDRLAVFAVQGKRRTLRECLRIEGWCNWSFNVFPLLRLGLSALYAKTAGKTNMNAPLTINKTVVYELNWIAKHLESMDRVFLFKSMDWNPLTEPDVTIAYTDASTSHGMRFWFPEFAQGFQCPILSSWPCYNVDFLEALSVVSAIHYAASITSRPQKLAVYTDSTFAVDIFSSL